LAPLRCGGTHLATALAAAFAMHFQCTCSALAMLTRTLGALLLETVLRPDDDDDQHNHIGRLVTLG